MNERPDWLIDQAAGASPSSVSPGDPAYVQWYLPTWGERIKLMGWWNLLWIPVIAAFATLVLSLADGIVPWAALFWLKVWIAVVALPLGIAIRQAAAALRKRRDPFCIHCGYSLVGRPDGTPCPECGGATSEALCREYQRDPHWFIQRWDARHRTPREGGALVVTGNHNPSRGDGT